MLYIAINAFIYTEVFKTMVDTNILFHTPAFKFEMINLNSSDGIDILLSFCLIFIFSCLSYLTVVCNLIFFATIGDSSVSFLRFNLMQAERLQLGNVYASFS